MGAHVFRAVDHWQGAATVASGGTDYPLSNVSVTVVAYFDAAQDGSETDTGERVWSARTGHLRAAVGSEVTITLEGGDPTPARVGYEGALFGDGVPSPLEKRPAVTRAP